MKLIEDVPQLAALVTLVRGEFGEMPDMALSVPQACVLWNVDRPLITRALEALVAEGFLRRRQGRYVRA